VASGGRDEAQAFKMWATGGSQYGHTERISDLKLEI